MKKKLNNFFKKLGVVVMTLAMLITMIPATEYSAETDINGPVIESISLEQNGKTDLKVGDKLTLTFSGYDQDSEITWVQAKTGIRDLNGKFLQEFKGTPVKGEGNTYTFEDYILSDAIGDCIITKFDVCDSNGNITTIDVNYTFTVVPTYDETTVVSITTDKPSIIFDENNLTGEITSTATISGNTKDISWMRVTYNVTDKDGFSYEDVFTFESTANGTYVSTLSFESPTVSRTYTVKSISIMYTDNTSAVLKNIPTASFAIENNITDQTGPSFISISMDKQGQILESGEVKFTVTASDESTLSDTAYVCLEAGVDNSSPYAHIELTHIGNGVYEGTIDVSTLYTCNYWISYIQLEDIFGNSTMYSCEQYTDLIDYEFGVMRDGVYLEGAYEDVNIYLWNDWNDIEPLKEFTKDISHSGVTLGDLLGADYLELGADSSLGAFVGWKDVFTGKVYTKDTVIKAEGDNDVFNLIPQYEKVCYYVYKIELDADGELYQTRVKHITDKNLTASELIAAIGNGTNAGAYTFKSWRSDYNADTVIMDTEVWLYAQYDKFPVYLEMAYIDASGNVATYVTTKDYAAGTTLQQVYDEAIAAIGSENLASVIGWDSYYYDVESMLDEEVNSTSSLELLARYSDKNIVRYEYGYIGEENGAGKSKYVDGYAVINKSLATDMNGIRTETDKLVGTLPIWSALTVNEETEMYAYYGNNNEIVQIVVWHTYKDTLLYVYRDEDSTVYKVSAGQTVTLPTEENGKQIGWYSMDDDKTYYGSYTIPADAEEGMSYYLYSTTETNDAVISDQVVVQKPAVVLDEEKVEETVADIKEAIIAAETSGTTQTIVVDMKTEDGKVATQVPKEILEAAKGKNVAVVLDMGAYTWTINGGDIKAENLKDINLEVTLNTSNIPSDKVKQLAGNDPTYQISLTHNGDFGFKANLSLNVGADNAGQYGNLFYYDSDGRLVFQNAGLIDANGNVSVSFSHASEYVIIISDNVFVSSPNTADNTNIILYVGLLVSAAVIAISLKKRNTI